MSTSTLDRYSNSSLKSEVFTTSAISQLFRQRSTATDSIVHTPLSVGQKGVTPQLDNVAKSQQTGGRKLVKKGDIVINSRSDRRGASGLSDRDGSVSLIYIVLKPNLEKINPEFAHHLIRSKGFQEEFYRFGTGIVADLWSTRYERMAQIRVPLPPMETQQRIADYLDRETAEIDAAVADLDRYVELLEKRKRATGLAILEQARHEPTTLMVHLGSLGLFVSGSGFPHRYQGVEGEEFPFYKVGSLSTADEDGIIQDSRHSVSREVAEELGAKIIPTGSVLMAKIGEAMRLCRFVVTATDCCIDNNMMAIIPRQDNITSDYLRLALELVTVDVLVNPGPVPSLNVQGLRMFSIPLPSVGVQKRMTTEWNKETDRLDSLIAESTRLRDLLLKRRSVLITEVVTGRKQV